MAACIYTGARVLFEDYGYQVAADLFQCGNQVLIQWMPQSKDYDPREPTHHVAIGHGYHHEDRGVTVVASHDCIGPRR